jgi:hypothetical protein
MSGCRPESIMSGHHQDTPDNMKSGRTPDKQRSGRPKYRTIAGQAAALVVLELT